MEFSTWTESGLDISHKEIYSIFAPFVDQKFVSHDPEWRAEIRRRKFAITRKCLKLILLNRSTRTQRSKKAVIEEYSKAWHPDGYSSYCLKGPFPRLSPWEYRGENMFASDVGSTRVRQLILIRILEHLKPRRVIEIGCGNGINLLMLAGRFPEIEFTGVELTHEGHRAALGFQQRDTMPEAMMQYIPLPLKDDLAFKRINFVQGTASDLPFEDGEYDLVYTILALEQMEGIRDKALLEIARVSNSYALMLEPFRDVNAWVWPRANVIQRQYFRGSIDDLPRYGLKPMVAVNDFPQEVFLKACMVLSRKFSRD